MLVDRARTARLSTQEVETSRLRTHVLVGGEIGAPPLVLVHGNAASSVFFEDLMVRLAGSFRVVAPDLRGYGQTETRTVDARRGLRDFSDDLHELLERLGLTSSPLPLLGWSLGGGVVMQYALDHPGGVSRLVLESPMSPYGFGGTRDPAGTPCWQDAAGSGGGSANPELVQRMAEGDRSDDSVVSPRRVLTTMYMREGTDLGEGWEEVLLTSMLATAIGDGNYPGDSIASPNWPHVSPGTRGVVNAISPKYCDISGFAELSPMPPILWLRGADDQIVSDTSLSEFGYLGKLGLVPDWPGEAVYPPQPMVSQLRSVLDQCRERGGRVEEVVIPECGHSPHLEHPERAATTVGQFLRREP